ncbi:hypothetical protein [Brevibacterium album]|uniref:hypothetical protein n=1 Tax=Brevibacterium album TaxID=417948 RepID=UPI0003FA3ECD|nr:hypothetical protein [Brevibacterium album]
MTAEGDAARPEAGALPALPTVLSAAEARSRGLHLLLGGGAGRSRAGGWEPGAAALRGEAEAGLIHHPMWAVRFAVRRGPAGFDRVLCLVDAVTSTAHMVSEPVLAAAVERVLRAGDAGEGADTAVPHREPRVSAAQAAEASRAAAAAAIRKRAKLAFLFALDQDGEPQLLLKPNWHVRARGSEASAEFLLDGLDGTHYVISYRKA